MGMLVVRTRGLEVVRTSKGMDRTHPVEQMICGSRTRRAWQDRQRGYLRLHHNGSSSCSEDKEMREAEWVKVRSQSGKRSRLCGFVDVRVYS